jgi:hypothetical protein
MEINELTQPFVLCLKEGSYKVCFDHEEGKKTFLSATNEETKEKKVFQVKNYSKGSGNEHLIGSLEEQASKEYVSQMFNIVFGYYPDNVRTKEVLQ